MRYAAITLSLLPGPKHTINICTHEHLMAELGTYAVHMDYSHGRLKRDGQTTRELAILAVIMDYFRTTCMGTPGRALSPGSHARQYATEHEADRKRASHDHEKCVTVSPCCFSRMDGDICGVASHLDPRPPRRGGFSCSHPEPLIGPPLTIWRAARLSDGGGDFREVGGAQQLPPPKKTGTDSVTDSSKLCREEISARERRHLRREPEWDGWRAEVRLSARGGAECGHGGLGSWKTVICAGVRLHSSSVS